MDSIRDALINAVAQKGDDSKAQSLIAQAKSLENEKLEAEIAADERFDELMDLVEATFNGAYVPKGQKLRPDIMHMAFDKVNKLADKGGEEYDKALRAVQHAWDDQHEYKHYHRDAVQAVIYPPKGFKTWLDYNKTVYARP